MVATQLQHRSVEVLTIPVLDTNYAYLIVSGMSAIAVDAGDAGPILDVVRERRLALTHILVTHGHGDHTRGLAELRRQTGAQAIGPDGAGIDPLDRFVAGGDRFQLLDIDIRVIDTQGHLPVHLAYQLPQERIVFSGDCLFGGGCGRLHPGLAAQYLESIGRINAMPGDTAVYFGHEYTEDNLAFAASMEPSNTAIAERRAAVDVRRKSGAPSAPSFLDDERATNPFLRLRSPELRRSLAVPETAPDLDAFIALRAAKDRW